MNHTDERYVNRRRDPDGNIEWEESDFFERDLLEEGEVELIDDVDAFIRIDPCWDLAEMEAVLLLVCDLVMR